MQVFLNSSKFRKLRGGIIRNLLLLCMLEFVLSVIENESKKGYRMHLYNFQHVIQEWVVQIFAFEIDDGADYKLLVLLYCCLNCRFIEIVPLCRRIELA